MRRKIGLAGALAGATTLALALTPVASANTAAAPTSISFSGGQVVGTTSAPQTVTVTTTCSLSFMGSCLIQGSFVATPAITGDFAQTNNCGSGLSTGESCTFDVTFKPTGTGLRTGQLSVGFDITGTSQPATIDLTGSGQPAPTTGGGGSGGGATGTTGGKKKCKKKGKHHSASAAKKCKKKR